VSAFAAPDSISVVVAAYNAAEWISATLGSIRDQTHVAHEIIVVDDGSTDNTAELVRSFGRRVGYVRRDHGGQPAARNAGIRAATGHFIAFCDADDLWRPRKLAAQVGLLHAQGCAWVVCDADWIDYDGKPVNVSMPPLRQGDVLESLFLGNFIKSATPVVRRDVFGVVGYFNEAPDARIGEDWDMWLRIAARYPLGVVREKLATIRLHADSMLARSPLAERAQGLRDVAEKAAALEPERLGPLKRRALAAIWHGAGVQSVRARRFEDARTYFRQELRCRPWNPAGLAYLTLCGLGPKVASSMFRLKELLW
jgi:glycosyltransferase involved in cell wall biosynthesis